ncbi:G-PROTEIN-RECEP-F1-2 domain-containing protein [Aphelenchoides besseyi]|nr:G-PROTEIN-RECEP-F1-2 domain-containing protein [Aphelenchoides besseyi]
MVVLIRCGFLTKWRNGIYILAFGNLIGDTFQQALVFIYVVPTSIAQSFIVSDDRRHPVVIMFAYLFLVFWYSGLAIQSFIAIDRLLNVVFPRVVKNWSSQVYIISIIAIYVLVFSMAVVSQLLLPCCTAYIYFGSFGYAYLGDGFNYSDHYIDLPLNSICTLLMFVCYAWIYLFLKRTNAVVPLRLDEKLRRKYREGKMALQFGVIATVLAFTWISFRIFPLLIPPTIPQLYSLVTFALSFHCGSNSFIFLTMNKEFQKCFLETYTLGERHRLFFVLPIKTVGLGDNRKPTTNQSTQMTQPR